MSKKYVLRWCKKAESDLRAVRELLEAKTPLTDIICFHCQQAVEKYLKAFLTSQNIEAGRTHDIGYLLDLCAKRDNDFLGLLEKEKASQLTDFAVDVRYPEEFYIPTIEETKEYFTLAIRVKEFILGKLGIREEDLMEEEK